MAALGVAALVAATAAIVASGATPALATVANSPGNTLASVVPSTAIPHGRVTFAVSCASVGATAATLSGQMLGLTGHIQMRASSTPGEFTVSVLLPGSIRPGIYHPGIDCSDGTSTTARLLVPAFGADASAQTGGAATSSATSTWLTVAGLVLMGVGAVTGGIALRRWHSSRSDRPDLPEDTGHPEHSDPFDYSGHSNFRF
jgi:hypothetical protein